MNLNFQNYEYFSHAITVGGKLLEVPLRKGQKDSAFIDALTFTIKKQTIDIVKGLCVTDRNLCKTTPKKAETHHVSAF